MSTWILKLFFIGRVHRHWDCQCGWSNGELGFPGSHLEDHQMCSNRFVIRGRERERGRGGLVGRVEVGYQVRKETESLERERGVVHMKNINL